MRSKSGLNLINMSVDEELKSREQFIQQVAENIVNNHSKHRDSFIFGISGKWGEGKTRFLNNLEKELGEKGFIVVDFNPWKFASDKVSFLRSFLALIKSKVEKGPWEKFKDWALSKDDTLNLYYDVSSNKINKLLLAGSFVVAIVIPFIYSKLSLVQRNSVKEFKWAITLLAVPAVASLLGKMISVQKSSKAVSTLDSFESLLKQYIAQFNGIKLVVFVDDLDRVTPEVARNVLDNLRTFFDKPELTFVVAGDHTVLERYLGNDLLPEGKEPEKLEEGRRFLKKIFNVYWRLPLPIDSELQSFLAKTFQDRALDIGKVLPKTEDQIKFQELLAKYFEKNFRHILRFLDTVIFTFGIIKNLKESAGEDDNKSYYVEMESNPLLVIRILMIQELCAPLFEKITENVDLLRLLEYAADKQNNDAIEEKMDSFESILSSSQRSFILRFLFEKPKFYEDAVLKVSDIRPFLHLAADAGFGDSRGASAEDFALILDRGNPDEVKQVLVSSGEEKIIVGADKFIERVNVSPDYNQKNSYISTVVKALCDIEVDLKLHSIFLEKMLSLDFEFYKQFPPQNRVENYRPFWQWLDKNSENELAKKYKEKFIYITSEDLNYLPQENNFGEISSSIIMSWFVSYYPQNKQDVLVRIQNVAPRMEKSEVKNYIKQIVEDMISEIATNADDNFRNLRCLLIAGYAEESIERLRSIVFDRINNMDEAMWNFAVSKAGEKNALWTREELEKVLLDKIDLLSEHSQLISIFRFSIGKVQHRLDELWETIIKKHPILFFDNFYQIMDDQSFISMAPSDEKAKSLFDKFFETIKTLEDSQKVEKLGYMLESRWIWHNLHRIRKGKFSAFNKSEEQVKQKAMEISEGWTQKIEQIS